jgi:4-amino-4-deoxy-L-arabinose transferase-like glycosyltransferase
MSNESSTRIDWRLCLLLFSAVFLLALPQVALLPLLDRDEPRFAEASREMVQSDNYIVPTFNHAPRYAKPPLIYWCQAACFTVFGENAFAARLPSLVAMAGTACVLLVWAIRLGAPQIGFGAALGYAFCFQAIQQGRVATADALLIFFMTVTAFAGWRILTPKTPGCPHPICVIMLALGFGLGFLAKGPEAWLPLIPLLVCARGMGGGTIGRIIVAFLAGTVLVLLWAIPAYLETHGDYWRVGLSEGVGQRAISGLQGHGSTGLVSYLAFLPYYLVLFWLSALPWSPLLVTQRKALFAAWKPNAIELYLLLNAGLIFLVFTLMVTKLPHYTLPAFPFLALCLAWRWNSVGLSPHRLTRLGWRMGFAFFLVALIGIPLALSRGMTPSPVGRLVAEAKGELTPDTQFAMVDFQEPNAIWEMRRVVSGYGQSIGEEKVMSFLNEPGPHAVILTSALWRKLSPPPTPPGLEVFESPGFNAAKGGFNDLTLVVKR